MLLRQIYEPGLAQYSYLLGCPRCKQALIVDPLRDIDRYLDLSDREGVEIVGVVETHIHADFLSGAREMAERLGVRAYLSGEGGDAWSYGWGSSARGAHPDEPETHLLRDGDTIEVGEVELRARHTPGHTPEHLCFLVTDRGSAATPIGLLSGDFLLVSDLGRPDLLEKAAGQEATAQAAARDLYRSLASLDPLEDHLQVWPAHGAGSSCGKAIGAVPVTTLGYERRYNEALRSRDDGEEAFVASILRDQPTPPTYFGRMKRTNREGPPALRRLPRPRRLAVEELAAVGRHGETVVIDTRTDRGAFMSAHLPDSLYAPADRTFSAAVGSVLTEATRAIVLIAPEAEVEERVRSLVRMGYDRVVGFATPADLEEHVRAGGEMERLRAVDFGEVREMLDDGSFRVVDVRDDFEFRDGYIEGAINAPYTRLPEYLWSRIPRGEPLIVHCESGVRSAVAAAWLAAQGREVVYVDDDWSNWEDG